MIKTLGKRRRRIAEQPQAMPVITREDRVYNTTNTPLKMQEYGRLIVQMVDFAKTLPTKEERTAYAYEIIRVMGGLNPHMKNVPDYQLKLWDHLAYLSDYELDIDYPVEIRRYNEDQQLHRLSYPGNKIKLRHYGFLVEEMLRLLEENAGSPSRDQLIIQVADRMRKNLIDWKGDTADEVRIAHDIAHYTNNAVTVEEVLECLPKSLQPKRGRRK